MTYLSTVLAVPSNEASARSAAKNRDGSLLGRLLAGYRRWSLRRETLAELSRLSDEQLNDIGIERRELETLVDQLVHQHGRA